jgi:hypothetical protein
MVPIKKTPKGALIDNGFINGYVGDTHIQRIPTPSHMYCFKPETSKNLKHS